MAFARTALLGVMLACTLPPWRMAAQPAMDSRQVIGAFLNGHLPGSTPGTAYAAVDAFPALRFQDPIKMVQRPSTTEMWVIGQEGHVWSFDRNSPTSKTLILDISDVTVGHGEGEGDSGLLGIAFHPQFGQLGSANRGYVYLYYSFRPAGAGWSTLSYNRLSRFTLPDGASQIDRASEQVLINQFDQKTWHNGGDLFFGPDGFLYVVNGDEGTGIPGGAVSNSQKIDSGLFSGVLRIDVDRDPSRSHPIRRQPVGSAMPPSGWPSTYTQNYYVPNDNPWIDPGGSVLEEFYAIGLRSPHRMSFDSVTGSALISDTGHATAEEINVLARGANYQWAYFEGTAPGLVPGLHGPGTEAPPLYEYSNRTVDGSAVIGGHVYRGQAHAADLGGRYVFGDFISGKVWALDWQQAGTPRRWLVTLPRGGDFGGLSGFGVDAEGEIYMMVLGSQGRIYQLQNLGTGPQPPATLSGTHAFSDLATLTPAAGIVPFSVNSPLWSDGAHKMRWIALPNDGAPYLADEVVGYSASGDWTFPAGTVLIKHFELAVDETNPANHKRLETRFLVRTATGWYGVTYRWREDGAEADLLPAGAAANLNIALAGGGTRAQTWTFPSREDCMTCHNANTGGALGPKTAQLNGLFAYPSTGVTANQLATWSSIGMFDAALTAEQIDAAPAMAPLTDVSVSPETRMRSYLDSNCAQCHRPWGPMRAEFDARYSTPLSQQNLVDAVPVGDFGIAGAKVVAPGSPGQSLLHVRMGAVNQDRMPPLGRSVLDQDALTVLRQWIARLAGGPNSAPVLAQPAAQSAPRGTAVNLPMSASDADGNPLSYTAVGLPPGLKIDFSSGVISGILSPSAPDANHVIVTVSDGDLSDQKSFDWTTSEVPIPAGLIGGDIGDVEIPGSTTYQSTTGVYTLKGSGADIFYNADGFHFASTTLTGDGEITARVTSQTNTASWAKAGVMIRETSAAGSRHATTYVTPVETGNGYEVIWRKTTNGSTQYVGGPGNNPAPNNWVRLVRAGDVLTGYASANGQAWTLVHSVNLGGLPATVAIGLVVTSANNAELGTATFDQVRIIGSTPASQPPAMPGGLSGAGMVDGIHLSWMDMSSNETGFEIQRRPAGGSFMLLQSTVADDTGIADGSVLPGVTYEYRVRATGVFGDSAWTTPVTVVAAGSATSYQLWLQAHGLPMDGSGSGGPTACPAQDGVANLIKFALGLSPSDPGYGGRLRHGTAVVGDLSYLTLTYTRPDPPPEGVTCSVEASADLLNWSADGLVEISNVADAGLRSITVRDGAPSGGANAGRFLRVRVTQP